MKTKLSRQIGTVYFYSMDMYFIALLAPEEVNRQVLKWKLWIKERYQCEVALRSPAHITLIPPCWLSPELENNLEDSLARFSAGQQSFGIELNNFSCFKPRVIFVEVMPSSQLATLQHELTGYLSATGDYPVKPETRPFHPHVTIATRDLYKKPFYEAWEYFKEKKYAANWMAGGISLLKHNKKNWDVIYTSRFKED